MTGPMTKFLDPEAPHIRWLAIIVAIALAATIAYLSLTPSSAAPRLQWSDKVQHFIAYAALTGPLAIAFGRKRFVWAVVVATAYGLLMEFAQGWMTADRVPSLLDTLANIAGAIAGAGLAELSIRIFRIARA